MTTIYAVSSGHPPAAIAVLRVSGADAFAVVTALAGSLPPPRMAQLRSLRDPALGALLDQAIILAFPGPATATGEDLVELHLHGGRAVVRAVEAALAADPRTRAAEAGEFTRRALLNGRIDMTEAEGLADLLTAETELQRRAAIQASGGMLRRTIDTLLDDILAVSARAEALLDFSDEADVGDDDAEVALLRTDIAKVAGTLADLVARPTVDRLRDGFRVVLAGPPNSGKSTLINALVDREVAIVSDIAGTTRDRIEAHVVVEGYPITLTDTAGLAEDSSDPIERIGIERAQDAMAQADVLLWLGDEAVPGAHADRVIALHPRADEAGRGGAREGRLSISARTGDGLADLWQRVIAAVADLTPPADSVAMNQRQHALMSDAREALEAASRETDLLLIAEQLRRARLAFDRITGRADVEAMLDALFGRFCIGK
ncbi:tRNA uridine-5-carboxymethylaminomethyl(34) synthesis GTPase MnmE [Sphingomonas sp. S1-29]|uniref:tRNA uridine-5-carboxymethylaminomethyl(34) synthesis GTPase MnmE n=1 Tax=Sphingomonas sp. S1-29 TaxID=2991074 RepID=UPI00223F9837|nr:tRNA uridine-5-carboxymethylaminomethyl(34) synthesis GTPase MnmE [Sphingomonas sp. S1-29]UZK68480.1 tRNA uridine-5-carboxymethylaminomethyl(34) synthesis GTPase MnmE [Sphingomonas sp. S1-29]